MWTLQCYVNIVFIVGTLKFLTLNWKTNGQRFNAVVSQHLRMGFQESLWMGFTETWRGICWGDIADIGDVMVCEKTCSTPPIVHEGSKLTSSMELKSCENHWTPEPGWNPSSFAGLVTQASPCLTYRLVVINDINLVTMSAFHVYQNLFSCIVHRLHFNYVQLLHLVTIGDLPLAQVGRTRQLGLCKKLSPFHFLWAFGFNMIEHTHGPLKETVASPGRISSTQPNRVIFQTFDTSVAVLPTVWHASIEWLGCKICRISVLLSIFLHLRC